MTQIQSDNRDCRLLTLPVELQDRIYDFIFPNWSLAIFDHQDDLRPRRWLDETILLVSVGATLASGPPGYNLLLTCRDVYERVHGHYGQGFTGKLVIGKIKGVDSSRASTTRQNTRRLNALANPDILLQLNLKKWYEKVHTLHACFTLDLVTLPFDIRDMLPNLRLVEILIYNVDSDSPCGAWLGPYKGNTARRVSEHGADLWEYARDATQCFFGRSNHSDSRIGMYQNPHINPVWRVADAMVNVRCVQESLSTEIELIGAHHQWRGRASFAAISHIMQTCQGMTYWENGMGRGTYENLDTDQEPVPERFQWLAVD